MDLPFTRLQTVSPPLFDKLIEQMLFDSDQPVYDEEQRIRRRCSDSCSD